MTFNRGYSFTIPVAIYFPEVLSNTLLQALMFILEVFHEANTESGHYDEIWDIQLIGELKSLDCGRLIATSDTYDYSFTHM